MVMDCCENKNVIVPAMSAVERMGKFTGIGKTPQIAGNPIRLLRLSLVRLRVSARTTGMPFQRTSRGYGPG